MAARPRDREFVVFWLAGPIAVREHDDFVPAPPLRIIGRAYFNRHDMSDALTAAAGMFKRERDAFGYVVAPVKRQQP